MVTQCYLRRYLHFLHNLLTAPSTPATLDLSVDVADLLAGLHSALNSHTHLLTHCSDTDRKRLLDALAAPYDLYRANLYTRGLRPATPFPTRRITDFLHTVLQFLDAGIRASQTPESLCHAYNLLQLSPDHTSLAIGRLPPMLEGQVAYLSSGVPTPAQAADVLDALFASPLFRPDQNSFLLYPERPITPFLERGKLPDADAARNPLLAALLAANDPSIIVQDIDGHHRFAPTFRKADDLRAALHALAKNPVYAPLVRQHTQSVLDLYESVFQHASFTGRSGSMFGYEGIGCVYWHMVAKLLLATQECYDQALALGDPAAAKRLKILYYRVRSGLGFNKSAAQCGAFPPDPYSHTPKHAGAQQPGMTGQVKEELLTRLRELGISVRDGAIHFSPDLLQPTELTPPSPTPATFTTLTTTGRELTLPVPPHSIAFTFCQTPILITFSPNLTTPRLDIHHTSGQIESLPTLSLPPALTAQIFSRQNTLQHLHLHIPSPTS